MTISHLEPDQYEVVEPQFRHFLLDNAGIETLATGFRWTEGPVWMGDWNCLLFQDLPRNRTMQWSAKTGISVYRAPSGYANGQTRDREGRLIACSHQDRCLYRIEHDGRVRQLVTSHDGRRLNAPNDIVCHSDGSLWFTDPLYGISNDYEGGRQESEQRPALYRFVPGSGDIRIMADDFEGPNGLAFSPDERRLYVSETGDQTQDDPQQFIRAFDVIGEGSTTRLKGGARFYKIEPGYCDGMAVDEEGCLWSSAADGIHCIDRGGTLLGRVFLPNRVSNLTFGEVERNRLFICCSGALSALYVNCRGVSR